MRFCRLSNFLDDFERRRKVDAVAGLQRALVEAELIRQVRKRRLRRQLQGHDLAVQQEMVNGRSANPETTRHVAQREIPQRVR
jgi:hypothetical protein